MLTIQPQYLTLAKLLDGRLFQIPEYQRAYSWTSKQRGDLFGDLKKTYSKGPDEGHFMAPIVCLRRRKQTLGTDEYFVLDVVDGQQRLTTLILLLNAIKLNLSKKDKAEAKLREEIAGLLVKPGGDLLLLQTNHDTTHLFKNFLRKDRAPSSMTARTIADRELLKAIEECQAFVSEWQARSDGLTSLMALLKNRLFFLLHEVDDEKMVYTVFEVLNSRGLPIASLDRLKSTLMGAAFELKNANEDGVIRELHAIWQDVYRVIGLRQGLSAEALRFAATLDAKVTPNRPLGEDDSVDAFALKATAAPNIREIASWLLRVTEASDAVIADTRINAVTRIVQARLVAAAINLRDDLTPGERRPLIQRWEKISFRIYGMLDYDARTRVGDYVRLAWRIVQSKLTVKEIDAALAGIGEAFPVDKAIDALRKANCYEGWEDELRYFMFRYEEHLAKQQGQRLSADQWGKIWMVSPSNSIEHIWARSKAPEKQKHRLGNLVLLPPGVNSKLQDKPPKEKAKEYRKTGLLIAGEVADMIDSGGWNTKMIAEREGALLEWAASEWAD